MRIDFNTHKNIPILMLIFNLIVQGNFKTFLAPCAYFWIVLFFMYLYG